MSDSCKHKFIDSNHCLKCGWTPPGALAAPTGSAAWSTADPNGDGWWWWQGKPAGLVKATAVRSSEIVRCGREKRELAGSCNACQCRAEDTVIVVYLNTLTFRACNKCAAEIAAQLNRLAPNTEATDAQRSVR